MGLRSLTHLEHNWTLIYAFSAVYLLLIGPVNWLVGKWFRDFRLPTLFLAVCITAFAWIFFVIGRRGNGERAITYTLSEARPLPGGDYDATQWSSVFVTHGGDYDITHASPHSLYAVTADTDEIYGQILDGKEGRFLVHIPLFSWRNFIHRGSMSGPPPFTVKLLDPTPRPDPILHARKHARKSSFQYPLPRQTSSSFTLVAGPGFPKSPLGAWAQRGGQWYEMTIQPDGRLLAGNPLSLDQYQYNGRYMGLTEPESNGRDVAAHEAWVNSVITGLAQALLAHQSAEDALDPADHPPALQPMRLYVLERAPASFNIVSIDLGREVGYVLIDQVVAQPEEP